MGKKKKIEREHPFEKLKRRDGNPFDEATVKNWYVARAYVLDKLRKEVVSPDSNKSMKIVVEIDGDKELMLSVVRQVALSAHFPNYVEYDALGRLSRKNHTVVEVVTRDQNIDQELKKEQYLNNLLVFCQYTKNKVDQNKSDHLLPIDIDFDIVESASSEGEDVVLMTCEDVKAFLCSKDDAEIYGIDTRMAVLSGRVYDLGVEIDNLPYEDIHDARRYNRALNVFQYKLLPKKIGKLMDEKWDNNPIKVKNGLSNIFCADRFISVEDGIKEYCENKQKKLDCGKDGVSEESCWEENDFQLAVSEHTRWVVEKLILGFRPMNCKERARYGSLFGNQRKAYANMLKGDPRRLLKTFPEDYDDEHIDPTHINLCTFGELRRVDPDNRRYDSFLMLAIPKIIKKIEKDDKK